MPTVFLSPILNGWQSLLPGSGAPNASGFVNVYQAGTTTPQVSYTTSAGNVPTANPIPLSVGGVPPYEIWLTQGQAYKYVVTDSASSPIATYDNISGVNDIGNSIASVTTSIVPGTTATYTLGATGNRWLALYVGTVYGSAWNGNLAVTGNGSYTGTLSAASTATFGNVVLGNASVPGTLDWYQELTEALTITTLTGSGSVTGVVDSAKTTRIGNKVYTEIAFHVTNWGSRTGQVELTGMNFTASRDGMLGGFFGAGSNTAVPCFGVIAASGTTIKLYKQVDGTAFTAADAITVFSVNLSGFYSA